MLVAAGQSADGHGLRRGAGERLRRRAPGRAVPHRGRRGLGATRCPTACSAPRAARSTGDERMRGDGDENGGMSGRAGTGRSSSWACSSARRRQRRLHADRHGRPLVRRRARLLREGDRLGQDHGAGGAECRARLDARGAARARRRGPGSAASWPACAIARARRWRARASPSTRFTSARAARSSPPRSSPYGDGVYAADVPLGRPGSGSSGPRDARRAGLHPAIARIWRAPVTRARAGRARREPARQPALRRDVRRLRRRLRRRPRSPRRADAARAPRLQRRAARRVRAPRRARRGARRRADATGRPSGSSARRRRWPGALIALWGVAALLEARGATAAPRGARRRSAGSCDGALRASRARPPATRAPRSASSRALAVRLALRFRGHGGGDGQRARGRGVMAVFWPGTLPVMLALGLGLAVLSAPLRRYVPAVCAVAMIAIGLLTVAGRVRPHDRPARRRRRGPGGHHHAPR